MDFDLLDYYKKKQQYDSGASDTGLTTDNMNLLQSDPSQTLQEDQSAGSNIMQGVGGGLLAAAPATGPAAPILAGLGLVSNVVGGGANAQEENAQQRNQAQDKRNELAMMYQQILQGKKRADLENAQSGMDFLRGSSRVTRNA